MTELSIEQWMQELESAMRPAKGNGLSVQEIADAMGHGSAWVCKRLARLQKDGRLTVSQDYREAIDGRMRPIPVYRLKEKS